MVCRFILVGTGAISSTYVQVCSTMGSKRAIIVAVISRSGKCPKNLNGVPVFPNLSSVNDEIEYDAIIIGTPNGTHSDLIVEAARLGKHSLVEKPLDITPSACDAVEEAIARHNVLVGVTYQRRFSPDNIAVKKLLDSNAFGRVIGADLSAKFFRDQAYYDQAEYRGGYSVDGGGPFIQQAVHNVDILCWFFGKPSQVQSMLGTFNHTMEAEDHGVALLRYPDGMIASIIASTCSYPGFPARLEITTERGSFTLVNDTITEWHVDGVENPTKMMSPSNNFQVHAGAKSAKVSDISGHFSVVEDFVSAIENGKEEPSVTAHSARMATDLICQIYNVGGIYNSSGGSHCSGNGGNSGGGGGSVGGIDSSGSDGSCSGGDGGNNNKGGNGNTHGTPLLPWLLSCFADEAADTLDEQIFAVLKGGMSYIDLRNVNHKNVVDLTVKEARVIRAKLDCAGIRVNMLGSPIGKSSLDVDAQVDLERLRRLAVVGTVVGCNRVRIFSYYNSTTTTTSGGGGGPLSDEEWGKASLQRLKNLKAEASKLGMVLFLENEGGMYGDTVKHVLSLLKELRDDGRKVEEPQVFGSIFDFDNYLQVGEDCWKAWEQLRECTDAFHLKESRKVITGNNNGGDGGKYSFEHVPLGAGDVEARRILQNAKSIGFSGALSLEPHLTHSPAVMKTGPHGSGNMSLAELGPAATFQVAADAAIALISSVY
jgi:UDP-N-acetyl-2-amino-2-deoxyglucuronate dehydrogenase